jgi:hypothetical protein
MAVEDLAALTPEEIQERLKAYFDSEEGKSYLDNITASTSDEYTREPAATKDGRSIKNPRCYLL